MTNHQAIVDHDSERILLAAARKGDQEAFTLLYLANRRYIHDLCYRILRGQSHLVDDMVQEVFMIAWQKLDKFDGASRLRTWLHRVAFNRTVYELRKMGNARFDVSLEDVEPILGRSFDLTVGPKAAAALHVLKGSERLAVILHYFHGHTYRDLSKMLGKTEAALKADVHRGLLKMRQAVAA